MAATSKFERWTDGLAATERMIKELKTKHGAEREHMAKRIAWRMGDPRYATKSAMRASGMQRQFAIELRVEYMDADKYEQIKKILRRTADELHANAALLADMQQPLVAITGTDFFEGFEDIKRWKEQEKLASRLEPSEVVHEEVEQPSAELLDALK